MNRTFKIATILAALILAAFSVVTRAQEEEPEDEFTGKIRIIAPMSEKVVGGGFSKLLEDIIAVLEKETGRDFEYFEVGYRTGDNDGLIVYNAFKNNEADFGYVSSIEYLLAEDEWSQIMIPAFTMVFNGSKEHSDCLYVREDSDYQTVEDLRGSKWGSSRVYPTRMLLYENGIDEPLDEFFGEALFIDDAPVIHSIQALQKGEVDAVTINKHHLVIGGGASVPGQEKQETLNVKYRELTCNRGEQHWIFVFHKKVPKEIRDELTKLMVRAHKDDAFAAFKFVFMALKGGFAPLAEKDLDRSREIVNLMKRNGWDKEGEEHTKKRDL